MEIKVNVELGMSPEMVSFATALLAINKAHNFGTPQNVNVNLRDLSTAPEVEKSAPQEEPKKTRRASKAKSAPAPEVEEPKKVAAEKSETEVEEEREESKTAVTLPDLRMMIARVWAGGKNKAITDGILAAHGAKNLTDLKEEDYSKVYNRLAEEAEKLGL